MKETIVDELKFSKAMMYTSKYKHSLQAVNYYFGPVHVQLGEKRG